MGWGRSSVAECLPSMHEGLDQTYWTWWLTTLISALWKWRQECQQFKDIFSYIVSEGECQARSLPEGEKTCLIH